MDATLLSTRDSLCLVGPLVVHLANEAIQNSSLVPSAELRQTGYKITILNKEEAAKIPRTTWNKKEIDTLDIYPLGIGGDNNEHIYHLVVVWAAGQRFRRDLGLPPKHFHIALSLEDDPSTDKGIRSLLPEQSKPHSPRLLDHLTYTLHLFSDYELEEKYCVEMVKLTPHEDRGFLRLADAANCQRKFKLAMLSYACAWENSEDDKVKKYCKKKLVECSQHTEWEHAFLEHERKQIPGTVVPFLARPWPILLRRELMSAGVTPTLSLAPREHVFLFLPSTPPAFHQLPRFFRWLIPFHFAIMSTPRCEEDIALLVSMGIKRVLTLTEEGPLPASWFAGKPISNTFIPVPNFRPPSIEQMTLIMRLFEDESNLPLLVHCGGGKGRAGTVAACYIAAYGFNLPHEQAYPQMPASDAVVSLRLIRPGSIETSEQENFVSRWCSTIWKQQCVLPELPSEPQPWPLEIVGNLTKDADLFILVGLPGSGKSWLSQALMKRNRKAWSCISQDEAGSRSVCESAIGRQPTTKHILLDRCNVSATDRMEWLRLAGNWVCSPVCVWFNYERDLCLSRAQQRTSHPTLPAGNRVRQAVSQMHEQFEMPSLDEGFKAIITIRSFSACEELVDSLCPPVGILKFPRTPHLINLGGATVDDIILDTSLILGHVVITEKVDGANMGFSLSRDRTKILVQNRSHYVNPTSHAQFKKLGYWLEQHHDDLVKVLNRDEHFAERYVLYGEWMYATHSIAYTHLPGLFMAFDLYDRVTGQFVSRSDLVALLHDTGLAIVPIMHEGDMPSEEVLKDMVQRTSCFWDGRVEGVYVKVEKDGVVFSRMKVVRSDFIPGSDHWSKGALRINGLVESFNSL